MRIFCNPSRVCQWLVVVSGLVSMLFACAEAPQKPAIVPQKPASFTEWKAGFRNDAVAAGIRVTTVDTALAGINENPRVIELDRQQPESVLTFDQYLARIVTSRRIQSGREKLDQYREILQRVENEYGVPANVVVALWGIESDFGRLTGGFSVIEALATLAYEGRRAEFFRGELLEALRILDTGDVTANAMRGSWAGAMGQSQFMPSTYRKYAVDFDGDGRRDIWQTPADVFASAAKYLSTIGWVRGQPWGQEAVLPPSTDVGPLGIEVQLPASDWLARGVKPLDGSFSALLDPGSIVQPAGPGGRAWLVGQNFRMILDWNRSSYFGVAVGLLADGIGAATLKP